MHAGGMDTPFDYFFNNRTNPRTIEAVRDGPLAAPLEVYALRLHEDGYSVPSGFVHYACWALSTAGAIVKG